MEFARANALNLSSLAIASVALVIAILALFPALIGILKTARDAILWLAVFVILGGGGFMAFMQMQALRVSAATSFAQPANNKPLYPGFQTVDNSSSAR